jgi:hypothetical protein
MSEKFEVVTLFKDINQMIENQYQTRIIILYLFGKFFESKKDSTSVYLS